MWLYWFVLTHIRTYSLTHTRTHALTHTRTHALVHTRIHALAHTRIHTRTLHAHHIRSLTHTHTYTHSMDIARRTRSQTSRLVIAQASPTANVAIEETHVSTVADRRVAIATAPPVPTVAVHDLTGGREVIREMPRPGNGGEANEIGSDNEHEGGPRA